MPGSGNGRQSWQQVDTFRWLSVVVSTVLGLAMARGLNGAILLFQHRREVTFDWLSAAWAAIIFLQQILFWWALEDLVHRPSPWTLPQFLLLAGLVLSLFMSSAVILPQAGHPLERDMRGYFEMDGRWSLLALALFNLLAILGNISLWGESFLSFQTLINVLAALTPALAFASGRRIQAAAIMLYCAIMMTGILELLPASY